MKKDIEQYILNKQIKKPNWFKIKLANFIISALLIKDKLTYDYDYDRKKIHKDPVIFLSTHSARNEYLFVLNGLKGLSINPVVGYQNIHSKGSFAFLDMFEAIPKQLFQPDLASVKKMLTILKNNGRLLLFPEGMQSASGSTLPINPATVKFLKKAKVNVVLCKSEGTYFCNPRYTSDRRHGKVKVHYSLLFTKEELETLSEEEINEKLQSNFKYNNFVDNFTNRYSYKGKKPIIDGLNNLIYKCPSCMSEFTHTIFHSAMKCTKCDCYSTLNEYYDLSFSKKTVPISTIDVWYKWQRKCVQQEIQQKDFCLKANGSLNILKDNVKYSYPNNYIEIMKGEVTLTAKGLELTNQEKTILFESKNVFSLTIVVKKEPLKSFLEFYYEKKFYILLLDIPNTHLIKWSIASEEIHFLQDQKWSQAAKEVYK